MNRSEAIFRWAVWAHVAALVYVVAADAFGLWPFGPEDA